MRDDLLDLLREANVQVLLTDLSDRALMPNAGSQQIAQKKHGFKTIPIREGHYIRCTEHVKQRVTSRLSQMGGLRHCLRLCVAVRICLGAETHSVPHTESSISSKCRLSGQDVTMNAIPHWRPPSDALAQRLRCDNARTEWQGAQDTFPSLSVRGHALAEVPQEHRKQRNDAEAATSALVLPAPIGQNVGRDEQSARIRGVWYIGQCFCAVDRSAITSKFPGPFFDTRMEMLDSAAC